MVSQPARAPQSVFARILYNVVTLSSKSHCINLPFLHAVTWLSRKMRYAWEFQMNNGLVMQSSEHAPTF